MPAAKNLATSGSESAIGAAADPKRGHKVDTVNRHDRA